ncbi:Short-chain fatty acids transporter [Serratia fonticola]|uniref:Short-chain fatty acids transporter n=1 Tax=Serratia fonticola TaxID=47917 RepID=A0A4U9TV24_SERFO|nr:Short-chain fatty acids transporter [Serratia fonticola]
MQMALIIVTGHALATSAPVKRILTLTASVAKTPAQGVMLVTFLGSVACVINWGFGLVVGAMFAREVARRIPGSDYPLLIACAYIGFLTWGGGFSGSMPLLAATPGNPVEHIAGLIPVSDTLFTGYNLFITLGLILVMPFVTRMMVPKPHEVVSVDPALLAEEPSFQKKLAADAPIAEKMEESRIIAFIIGALGIAYLGMSFWKRASTSRLIR